MLATHKPSCFHVFQLLKTTPWKEGKTVDTLCLKLIILAVLQLKKDS